MAPRTVIGPEFFSVTGEEMQIFYRGFCETPDIEIYGFGASGGADSQRHRRRYMTSKLNSPYVNGKYAFSIQDETGLEIAYAKTRIETIDADSLHSPTENTRVLCIGDSLTANSNGAWVTELNRLLTNEGGDPTGKGFENIEFIGTQNAQPNRHEGRVGKTWKWFAESTSPFWNNGKLDFGNYVTINNLGGIDQVYILLGYNSIQFGGPNAIDWNDDMDRAGLMIDAILADYPNAKIGLLSLLGYAREGMIGNRKWYDYLRRTFGYKLALDSLSDEYENVRWIDLQSQFDADYSFPNVQVNVNSRTPAWQEQKISDSIHPNVFGYRQIADAVYRDFIAYWCR